MTPPAPDWIRLRSEHLTVEMDPQGAQLSTLRDAAGNDLLWNGDATVWNGRAPILFPIVGALNNGQYRWHWHRYALSRHGFARGQRFELIRQTSSEALFRLNDTVATRAVYPFGFELDVEFRLVGSTLTVEASVRNTSDKPMPASLGFHPAFRWPLPNGAAREAHFLEFEYAEEAAVRRLDAAGLLTPELHPTPVQDRRLPLTDALFVDDVIIFDELHSDSLTYGAERGPRLRIGFPGARYLGLWTKPGAGFICIEPWRGFADPVGFEGKFDEKPGMLQVAPGLAQSLTMTIEHEDVK